MKYIDKLDIYEDCLYTTDDIDINKNPIWYNTFKSALQNLKEDNTIVIYNPNALNYVPIDWSGTLLESKGLSKYAKYRVIKVSNDSILSEYFELNYSNMKGFNDYSFDYKMIYESIIPEKILNHKIWSDKYSNVYLDEDWRWHER